MIRLIKPTLKHADSYLALLNKWVREGAHPADDYALFNLSDQIRRWRNFEKGKPFGGETLPRSQWWVLDGVEIVGDVQIRHAADKLSPKSRISVRLTSDKPKPQYEDTLMEFVLQKAKRLRLSIAA